MSEQKAILDHMIEAYGKSITENRTPRRWEINQPAKTALMADPRIYKCDLGRSKQLEDIPLFGAPICMMHDRSTDPKFNLIVDELPMKGTSDAQQSYKY